MENSRRLLEKRIHGKFDSSGRFVSLDGSPVDFITSNIGSQNSPNSTPNDAREATENKPLLGDSDYQKGAGEYDGDLKKLKDAIDNGDMESAKDALDKISDKLGKEGKKEAKDAIDKAKDMLDKLNKGQMPSKEDIDDLADKVRNITGDDPVGENSTEDGDSGESASEEDGDSNSSDSSNSNSNQQSNQNKQGSGKGKQSSQGQQGDGQGQQDDQNQQGSGQGQQGDQDSQGQQSSQGSQGTQGSQSKQGNQGQQGQGDEDNSPIEEPDPDVIYVDLNTNFRYKWNGKEFERL